MGQQNTALMVYQLLVCGQNMEQYQLNQGRKNNQGQKIPELKLNLISLSSAVAYPASKTGTSTR